MPGWEEPNLTRKFKTRSRDRKGATTETEIHPKKWQNDSMSWLSWQTTTAVSCEIRTKRMKEMLVRNLFLLRTALTLFPITLFFCLKGLYRCLWLTLLCCFLVQLVLFQEKDKTSARNVDKTFYNNKTCHPMFPPSLGPKCWSFYFTSPSSFSVGGEGPKALTWMDFLSWGSCEVKVKTDQDLLRIRRRDTERVADVGRKYCKR